MTAIKCFVEECTYNKNHGCAAYNIEVRSSATKQVEGPDNTACATFNHA
ncbi:MAG: DUF1540 domain-containing protein [Clostridiales bacterium]